ncbi:MAG: sigma-54-dependent Fis family transcriptional regulator [Candidatus Hydrogenedentes bacterium]|nr:sigma-54-dependent Fis family transcriptional regulator [Candidatus Hydrogenedentota bacterium]
MKKVLILEDDRDFAESLRRAVGGRYELVIASTVDDAKSRLNDDVPLVLVDLFLGEVHSGAPEGLTFLKWLASERPDTAAVVLSGYGDMDLAIEAMKAGAEDFIDKGRLNVAELEKRLEGILERKRLRLENVLLRSRLELYETRSLVGSSSVMADLRRVIRTVAEDGSVTVLLRGETGTGKELAARMIHETGVRRDKPFIPVDLSCLPKETLASELFGHERGAFTGAEKQHRGYLEEANGGILFLDEVTDLPSDMQNKLLRVIEERAVVRLGSTKPIPVDIQLLAATNEDIESLVSKGYFRKDLYYRLKVFEITLPALRQHASDIPVIVNHFLQQWELRTPLRSVSSQAMELFVSYSWPGNVRELRNALEFASIQAKIRHAATLLPEHLPIEVRTGAGLSPKGEPTYPDLSVDVAMAHAELECVLRALRQTNGVKEKACALLGYKNRHTMLRRIETIAQNHPAVWSSYPELETYYGQSNKRKKK